MDMEQERDRDTAGSADAGQNHRAGSGSSRLRWVWAIAGSFLAILVLLTATGRIDSLARTLWRGLSTDDAVTTEDRVLPRTEPAAGSGTFTFLEHDLHPDILFQPYTAGAIVGDSSAPTARIIRGFRELLALYQQRQGEDDNFTVRVVDNRNNEVLELFVLEELRDNYERTGAADWDQIDRLRREHTRRLVDKYAARGIPRSAVTVKWGRANQVLEARHRDVGDIGRTRRDWARSIASFSTLSTSLHPP